MIITQTFEPYNERRWSRPWIALVTAWPVGAANPTLRWGAAARDGRDTEVEVEAEPGDIVRWGQRDLRGRGTWSRWGQVQPDGSIQPVSAAEARRMHRERPGAGRHAALLAQTIEGVALQDLLASLHMLLDGVSDDEIVAHTGLGEIDLERIRRSRAAVNSLFLEGALGV